ncbi:hypothetical protein ES703_17732 [subsurface metagenome]
METKEALRDRYVKAQQEGTFVERFRASGVYMDSIGDVLSDRVSDFPTEKQVKYVVSLPGTANPVTVEPEQETGFYFSLAGAANFTKFASGEPVVKAEPVAHLYWLEEAFPGFRVEKKEQVEVYPGYWVSSEEYERRFKGVDLDYFRNLLPPELFEVYVHTMGLVEGWGIRPKDRFKGKD